MDHLQSFLGRNPQACYTQIGHDEIVILNPINENLYLLNESAVDLWLSLEKPKTAVELVQTLAEKYSGHSEVYRQDVIEWIADMKQKGLLSEFYIR